MKKILLASLLSVMSILVSSADTFGTIARVVSVFYGTKASKNPNNPCEGATYRKCAEIDTQLTQLTNYVNVSTTTKDADGNVVNKSTDTYYGTIDEYLNEAMANLPTNATMEVDNP